MRRTILKAQAGVKFQGIIIHNWQDTEIESDECDADEQDHFPPFMRSLKTWYAALGQNGWIGDLGIIDGYAIRIDVMVSIGKAGIFIEREVANLAF